MDKERLKDLRHTKCTTCNGDGTIRIYESENAYDREDDKLPSGYLSSRRSLNRGFYQNVKCSLCEGDGYLLEPIYE
ncbi:hypothetical protein [Aquibacillus salsiterrae]|uniref:Uncharacterized protein n=1 Tax=Aquibacillus salsiterrae TaxID=2950439 RepID=A0A9X3WF10_9BACI|nr:hypothetical protein [Aquibacillus salsiterrae]MDC3418610.1 hypothetical protein [Aquibacillus salsiterrae]